MVAGIKFKNVKQQGFCSPQFSLLFNLVGHNFIREKSRYQK
ncbi:hypothetical protein AHMF7616_03037 [Adhaeribacter pallidiroseus]|uniref:Uncharacterized protein n=1 Tax=Adhaeribacter pallidiroseus TaxID=2072847 RepID=A0A369QHN4_9BACT|nr:hypothetical protein AHMF7616_03037 [Adhaeribacter pallidiroseus]